MFNKAEAAAGRARAGLGARRPRTWMRSAPPSARPRAEARALRRPRLPIASRGARRLAEQRVETVARVKRQRSRKATSRAPRAPRGRGDSRGRAARVGWRQLDDRTGRRRAIPTRRRRGLRWWRRARSISGRRLDTRRSARLRPAGWQSRASRMPNAHGSGRGCGRRCSMRLGSGKSWARGSRSGTGGL